MRDVISYVRPSHCLANHHIQGLGRLHKPDYDYDYNYNAHEILEYDYKYDYNAHEIKRIQQPWHLWQLTRCCRKGW